MAKETNLIIGSAIFLFLGVIATAVFHIYVGMKSAAETKSSNQK